MKTIQEMAWEARAVEAGFPIDGKHVHRIYGHELKAFAELVREDERQIIIAKNAPEIERVNEHIKNLERQAAVAAIKEALVRKEEREACAKVADNFAITSQYKTQRSLAEWCASSIRARSNT